MDERDDELRHLKVMTCESETVLSNPKDAAKDFKGYRARSLAKHLQWENLPFGKSPFLDFRGPRRKAKLRRDSRSRAS